jgi:chromatin segregation and condensation protein Rec8/ScpA/Scc1 (kleisin family)
MYRRGTAHFDELFENAKSRSEIIAIFYATLELLKAGRLSMLKAVGDITNSNIILECNRKHTRDESQTSAL